MNVRNIFRECLIVHKPLYLKHKLNIPIAYIIQIFVQSLEMSFYAAIVLSGWIEGKLNRLTR